MVNRNPWQYLIEQYLSNAISEEELVQLLQKAEHSEHLEGLTQALKGYWEKAKQEDAGSQADWDKKFELMMQETRQAVPVIPLQAKRKNRWILRVAAAAVFIMTIGTGAFFLLRDTQKETGAKTLSRRYANDITPGTNGAILTLASGQQIVLDSTGNGMLAVQGRTKVINRDGRVIYDKGGAAATELLYNTMTTPKGRQYQLVLADGSKVWLNAGSSIRYPAAFAGEERKVEITGEAYFEIAGLATPGGTGKVPFIVSVNGMNVEVLGTHFNINAYDDEAAIQTTLLEGKVKVSTGGMENILKPGQQAILNKAGTMKVINDADIDVVMAWKNGFFSFEQTDFATVMRQLSRWYDVDIEYAGKVPDRRFGGGISRNTNLSEVLQILEESKVYFKIEGKKIIVLS